MGGKSYKLNTPRVPTRALEEINQATAYHWAKEHAFDMELQDHSRAGAEHPRTPQPGAHGGKMGPERALLVVKGHIRWHTGRVRLETAT